VLGLVCALSTSLPAQGSQVPAPVGAVNDFADVIPLEYETQLNQLARALWEQTGTALVVATFEDIGGQNPEEFATRLYESWGIGTKGEDKGILIVVALKERRVRVETGYGVEAILPDAKVGGLMDHYIVPYLRQGEFGKGLLSGAMAFAQVVAQESGVQLNLDRVVGEPAHRVERKRRFPLLPLLFLIFVIFGLFGRGMGFFPFFFLPWIFMTGHGRPMGGGFGGFGGGFGGFGGGLSGGGGATRGF